MTSQTDGDAQLERTGGPGEAHYTVPSDTTKKLPPGTLFPMAHTSAILAAAQSGKKFLALPLFDGTDDTGSEDSFIVVLDWKKPEANKYAFLSNLAIQMSIEESEIRISLSSFAGGFRINEDRRTPH